MPRRLNRRAVLKAAGALGLTTAVAGCVGDDDDPDDDTADAVDDTTDDTADPVEDRDLMLGVLQPTSGDLGTLGGPIRDAAILPGEQLEGETRFGIDIREEDTESDPEAGVAAAQALVDAGYPAVTGAASSEVSINVAEGVFVPAGVTACSPASTSPDITDMDDDDYFFRTAPSDALQSRVMADVGFTEHGLETAATFHLNNAYGQALAAAFVDAFEELGGTITESVAFEAEQPSYTSALETALADDPELLIVVGYPDSGEQIFRDYYSDFDGDETIMVTDGLRSGSLPADIDNPMENVIGTAPLPAGPAAETFADLYEGEFGREPDVFNAHAYDASAVLLLANAAAGENDGTAIRDQMREVANPGGTEIGPDNLAEGIEMAADGEEIQYAGASSSVEFDENGDMAAVSYEIFEFSMDGVETTDTVDFEG